MSGFKIFSGNSNPQFSQRLTESLGTTPGRIELGRFADGEIRCEVHESVRGLNCFVVQSACSPVNQSYMELFIIMDTLKRSSAKEITAVIPYYGYARQDRKVAPRVPISAKLMADLLMAAGASRVVCMDLHAAQIQGFFDIPVDHLSALPSLARYFSTRSVAGESHVVVSPDSGGVERARSFAKRIDAPIAIIDKRRTGPNEARAFHLIGDVRDKTAVLVDDIIDTAGTLTQAIDSLMENGAKRVIAVASHGLFSGPAVERIEASSLSQVIVTDSVPLNEQARNCDKIEVVSVAPVLAEAIQRIDNNESVSSLFD